jgi:hypothetical protein
MDRPRDRGQGRFADPVRGWARPLAAGLLAAALLVLTQASSPAAPAGRWTTTGSMHGPRTDHTATLLAEGRVLVAGGFGPSGVLATAEIYDPTSGSWTMTGSMHEARSGHTATLLADGRVLVAGGFGPFGALASAEIYNPTKGSWKTTDSMDEARGDHTATLLAATQAVGPPLVLVAGGTQGEEFTLGTAELYDPAAGTWTTMGSMNVARFLHAATRLPNGRVLVTGGIHVDDYTATAEIYDPTSGSWKGTRPLHEARRWHTATLLDDGRVLVAGGSRGADDLVLGAELYQPATGSWTRTDDLEVGRQIHTATGLADGTVLVAGGFGPSPEFSRLASAELYAPRAKGAERWTRTADLLQGRGIHTATLLADGRVMVAGGSGAQGTVLASAELYTPARGL